MMDRLTKALDMRADLGVPARFWLRDDDAVGPASALDRLLRLTADRVPITLAVIPAFSGQPLADRLVAERHVSVAVHGWSHQNHAPEGEKKQELGRHRPVEVVLAELAEGLSRLSSLHGPQFLPVLVPPWNRIGNRVVAGLRGLGFQALSVFGPELPAPLPMLNTHVDLIDWRGTRGGRSDDDLIAEIVARLETGAPMGLLTHHLVHDEAAWGFLSRLIDATVGHPGCQWMPAQTLIS